MDILEKCESLLHELKNLVQQLELGEEKLRGIANEDYNGIEQILEQNFDVALRVNGCYDDFVHYLDQLHLEDGMRFHANRLEKELERLDVYVD